jgi:hypothetical protein
LSRRSSAGHEVAAAMEFPGTSYDFAFFDCLHDMGGLIGAAAHGVKSLKPDGAWMIGEPFANDRLEDNLIPIGRTYYSASTLIAQPLPLLRKERWDWALKQVKLGSERW